MSLQLYIIRHGETEWSLTGQHTGRTDIPLTANGEAGARELGQRIRGVSFTRVLTSPLQRAQRTCALMELQTATEIEPNLAEWDYGDYEGQRSADIAKTRPGWNIFQDGGPGGESPAQVAERADRLIASLSGVEGNVALFTHGHFGCVIAARWIGLPVIEGQHLMLDPTSLSILAQAKHHPEIRVIGLWNGTPALLAGKF